MKDLTFPDKIYLTERIVGVIAWSEAKVADGDACYINTEALAKKIGRHRAHLAEFSTMHAHHSIKVIKAIIDDFEALVLYGD